MKCQDENIWSGICSHCVHQYNARAANKQEPIVLESSVRLNLDPDRGDKGDEGERDGRDDGDDGGDGGDRDVGVTGLTKMTGMTGVTE